MSIVRGYMNLGMFFYFKKITVYNKERVPKDKPVLILGNHQNGLIDPLLVAVRFKRFFYFLTRAGVFTKPLLAKLFHVFQMLPVYRIRDGWGNLTNNNAIFENCTKLLSRGETVVIFPEGGHDLRRTVRPLSKGFTRIVLDTLEKHPKTDLQLIPMGLNYESPLKFPDSASIYFGEPVNAKDFYTGERNKDVVQLKSRIQSELSELTANIPIDNYAETLSKLEALNVDFLKPQAVNACIKNDFKAPVTKPKDSFVAIKKFFRFLLICNFIMPYAVWKYYAQPKIKELEFVATFRFAVTIVLGPLWLLLTALVVGLFFGFYIALAYVLASLAVVLLAVKL
ncbi:lysophospholipid acyltransferase family protein [Tamlana sp. 2_MG-2023]|uniref:lysophospholipid acyltransferase family protein n=1 Tax=unclassified Tamlana TaxID=2614803 RepID=UPI0026E1B87C|nr:MULTISPECIES: lysophospholipid acyltransferase family protein [unclassified Tamlana]MDO6758791.1 lysophospholipid acyltransferase family protein [Tamlana sp. 2_MG-2023]MDO6789490.1 lysophospholipid acyltransferase family protein [Tamlana sp. 1_MG-2023]